jgi:hypothetical protein
VVSLAGAVNPCDPDEGHPRPEIIKFIKLDNFKFKKLESMLYFTKFFKLGNLTMSVTLIYDARRDATNIVQYTKSEDGKRKATQIGSISASACHKYNRFKTVAEARSGNAKTTQYKKDLTQTYIALELQKFYENVLHREYVIKIQDYDYRYISAEKRHEVETSLGITEDDIHKILIEKERLTKNFHESLAKVFAQGVKLDAKTMLRTQDLIAELNKLEKLGKK